MMIDVVVYLSSLHKQNPGRKVDTLTAFAEGAKSQGASVHIETQYVLHPTKLAVILGWPSPIQTTENIKLRAKIVEQQRSQHNHIMSIDANCFKFKDVDSKYLRYSINGVDYDSSEYANKNSDSSRWNVLSNDIGLSMQDWKQNGEYILFLVQRVGGWSMKGLSPVKWARQKIAAIRKVSNLPIVLRPHPGKVADLTPLLCPGVTISDSINTTIEQDLTRAKAAFIFNSSSGVASILSGVPLWVDDSGSVCWDVANHNIENINSPTLLDRTHWINDLAACHWTDKESSQGLVYKKFLPYLT
ncbi:MAG: hypothetical protein SCH11_00735 [Nitrosomonadaceae bacterium]|nr:hypothetical protein [Nitrosomonadaceae bacterium]